MNGVRATDGYARRLPTGPCLGGLYGTDDREALIAADVLK